MENHGLQLKVSKQWLQKEFALIEHKLKQNEYSGLKPYFDDVR